MATAKKTAKPAPNRKPVPAKKTPVASAGKTAKPAPAAVPKQAAPVKAEKPKKPKLVRDSFTIPKLEYAVLDELKLRAAKSGKPAKKSEVLRAGIKALAAMSDAAFSAALSAVPLVKTGRPTKA